MHPVAGEALAAIGLGLRDLVFVVGEDQVLTTCMQIEAVSEILHGHYGALDVPARASGADGGLPLGFARLRGFP